MDTYELLMQLANRIESSSAGVETLQRAGILDKENNFTEPYKHLEMGKQKLETLESTRKSIFSELKGHCYVSKDNAYIEITEWSNGDGFDIDLSSYGEQYMRMTWGQFKLLKKLVKKLENSGYDDTVD